MPLPQTLLDQIQHLVIHLLDDVKSTINAMTLEEIQSKKNPLFRLIFSQNPREYLNLFVSERAERSLVTRFGHLIERVIQLLIVHQGGEILGKSNEWKPYDLKFALPAQGEFWIEIKSILEQNKSNWAEILRLKENAVNQGKNFRLCIYYPSRTQAPAELADVTLVGEDLWTFVGGASDIQDQIFAIISGLGADFSLHDIVAARVDQLLEELNQPSLLDFI